MDLKWVLLIHELGCLAAGWGRMRKQLWPGTGTGTAKRLIIINVSSTLTSWFNLQPSCLQLDFRLFIDDLFGFVFHFGSLYWVTCEFIYTHGYQPLEACDSMLWGEGDLHGQPMRGIMEAKHGLPPSGMQSQKLCWERHSYTTRSWSLVQQIGGSGGCRDPQNNTSYIISSYKSYEKSHRIIGDMRQAKVP